MMPDGLDSIGLGVVTLRHEAHHQHDFGHSHKADLLLVVDF